jgi:hypothetical protein
VAALDIRAGLLTIVAALAVSSCRAATESPPAGPSQPEPRLSFEPRLAFVSNRDGFSQIYAASEDGAEIFPVVPGIYASWSPDGPTSRGG